MIRGLEKGPLIPWAPEGGRTWEMGVLGGWDQGTGRLALRRRGVGGVVFCSLDVMESRGTSQGPAADMVCHAMCLGPPLPLPLHSSPRLGPSGCWAGSGAPVPRSPHGSVGGVIPGDWGTYQVWTWGGG